VRHLDRIVTRDFACRVDGVPSNLALDEQGATVGMRRFDWLDVDDVAFAEHSIRLRLADDSRIVATHLGARNDECARMLRELRGAARRPSLTATSFDPIAGFEARSARPGEPSPAIVDLLLFPNVLSIEPREGASTTVPLPLARSVRREGWTFTFDMRGLPDVDVRGLGARTDEFEERLQRARADLASATAEAYAAIDPGLSGLAAPDGWAVGAAEAGARWTPLLRAWLSLGRREAATGLANWSEPGRLRLGLWTEGGTTSMPFLIASRGGGPDARVVVEAVDGADRATFVFATEDIDRLNAILVLTAFRREALSLPLDELGRWAVAVRTQETVRALRSQLIARVPHDDGWAQKLKAALQG
jgi:hypothetical protein